ncbi:ribosome biogenesis protein [Canna indica]|uniref:Ribosome biogenesis protein n=1 Tax=Canna indica TaxID=4628 RepID=A0AAQ3KJQ1_9LILI|nr:ribosome biogenesis protein [Canna indica]
MKKIKLVGHPLKFFKKTAFIMFTSDLEAPKFEGTPVQTVNRIRGQDKKFQATINDTKQKGESPRGQMWKGMKTVAEVRRENNIPLPHNSIQIISLSNQKFVLICVLIGCLVLLLPQPIERKPIKFNPLEIPPKL